MSPSEAVKQAARLERTRPAGLASVLAYLEPFPLRDDPRALGWVLDLLMPHLLRLARAQRRVSVVCSPALRPRLESFGLPCFCPPAELLGIGGGEETDRAWVRLMSEPEHPGWMPFIDEALESARPSVILSWTWNAPLEHVAKEREIPILHLEKGPLRPPNPMTWYADVAGLSGASLLDQVWPMLRNQELTSEAERDLRAFLEQRLAAPDQAAPAVRARCGLEPGDPRRLIVLFLQVARDSTVLRWSRIGGNEALIGLFARAADPERFLVVVRCHPDDRPARAAATAEGLRFAPDDLPATSLLAAADAVATINSSTGFEALARGRIVYTFGASPYAGRGCTRDLGADPEALATALGAEPFELTAEECRLRDRLLHFLLFRYLRYEGDLQDPERLIAAVDAIAALPPGGDLLDLYPVRRLADIVPRLGPSANFHVFPGRAGQPYRVEETTGHPYLLDGNPRRFLIPVASDGSDHLRIDPGDRPAFHLVWRLEWFASLTARAPSLVQTGETLRAALSRGRTTELFRAGGAVAIDALDDDPAFKVPIPPGADRPALAILTMSSWPAPEARALADALQEAIDDPGAQDSLTSLLRQWRAQERELRAARERQELAAAALDGARRGAAGEREGLEKLLRETTAQLRREERRRLAGEAAREQMLRERAADAAELARLAAHVQELERGLAGATRQARARGHRLRAARAELVRSARRLEQAHADQAGAAAAQTTLRSRLVALSDRHEASSLELLDVREAAARERERADASLQRLAELEHRLALAQELLEEREQELAASEEARSRAEQELATLKAVSERPSSRSRVASALLFLPRAVELGAWFGLRTLTPKQVRFRLEPSHDVVKDGDEWIASGRDPAFYLAPIRHGMPGGVGYLSFHLWTEHGLVLPKLYVDSGNGFCEEQAIVLGPTPNGLCRRAVCLPPTVRELRLDPMDQTGRFRISDARWIVPNPVRQLFADACSDLRTKLRQPGMAWKRLRGVVREMRLDGVRPVLARRATARLLEPRQRPVDPCAYFRPPARLDPYDAWVQVNQPVPRRRGALISELERSGGDRPLISVLMPVFDTDPDHLRRAVQSVIDQVYDRWELVIADDASSDPRTLEELARCRERDARIRVVRRSENGGIARATNSAREGAGGTFLAFLDHDDLLDPEALAEVALYLHRQPETDFVYTDDDKIDLEGRRYAPQFKPDWSPELLLSYMYLSHLCVVRSTVFDAVGGIRPGFDGSQDHDFALRATERARHVGHIPRVLYHWRAARGSTASSGAAKPAAFAAGLRAVQEALDRRGVPATVHQPRWAVEGACGIYGLKGRDEGPSVAILIPSKNQLEVLRRCLDSLRATTYRNHRVYVLDNESDDPETLRFLASQDQATVLRIPNPVPGRFSFAHVVNEAVAQVEEELVLLLNNDTEVLAPEWLSQMVAWARLPGVGVVGGRLLYPDRRVQHAGIVRGYHGIVVGHAFKLAPASDNGYLSYAAVARNYGAVTGACLLTPRKLFVELGGFDAEAFAVAYNDVDYCYRVLERGLRCVYCPDAELVHHEGRSRGFVDEPKELVNLRERWGGRPDPYYNPNLSLAHERFGIEPRVMAPPATEPVRVLLSAFTLGWEGAPYVQYELAAGLKRRGIIDPVICCPQDGPLRKLYHEAGIEVRIVAHPLRLAGDRASYEDALETFARETLDDGIDLVHANTAQTFYAVDAARRRGRPSLWTIHESESWEHYYDFLPKDVAAEALRAFQFPYRVIFVSEASRKVWAPLNAHSNFTTLHNGLDGERMSRLGSRWTREKARRHLGLEDDEIAVILVGTVCERKGQKDLVEALAQLPASSRQRLRAFIVGDRPNAYSRSLRELAERLPRRARERLTIVQETGEVITYFRAADVFVCTSRVESFPRVIQEAMFFGLPVVTTPVFGISEQVRPGINGLFYDPGDAPALASALHRLVQDAELRQALGKRSPEVLRTLTSFEDMLAAYETLFRDAAVSSPFAPAPTA